MLKEAEAPGFVEKDAHDLVLNGTQPAYLTSGMAADFLGLIHTAQERDQYNRSCLISLSQTNVNISPPVLVPLFMAHSHCTGQDGIGTGNGTVIGA